MHLPRTAQAFTLVAYNTSFTLEGAWGFDPSHPTATLPATFSAVDTHYTCWDAGAVTGQPASAYALWVHARTTHTHTHTHIHVCGASGTVLCVLSRDPHHPSADSGGLSMHICAWHAPPHKRAPPTAHHRAQHHGCTSVGRWGDSVPCTQRTAA